MGHRAFKDRTYSQFARLGQALASEKRLELLDVLAQAPRHVEALAAETEMSVANVSQHLQVLRAARLVEAEREGTKVRYRLAGDEVLRLWLSLRALAQSRLAEVAEVTRELAEVRSEEPVGRAELAQLLESDGVFVIDVRPSLEYGYGHIPGAVSMPVGELPGRLDELPRDRPIVAYCRGEFCLFADQAVALLREHGFNAVRLDGGWPEWRVEGRPVSG